MEAAGALQHAQSTKTAELCVEMCGQGSALQTWEEQFAKKAMPAIEDCKNVSRQDGREGGEGRGEEKGQQGSGSGKNPNSR